MLAAAAGRSPFGVSAPAFSDTRPTYSRDAQDDEAAPHSDISGGTQVPPSVRCMHSMPALSCRTNVSACVCTCD